MLLEGQQAGGGSQSGEGAWASEAPVLACYIHAGSGSLRNKVFPLTSLGFELDCFLGLLPRAAAKISDGSQYYVLLIITDGVISDMTQTKEAIVSVSLWRRAWQGGVTYNNSEGVENLKLIK